MGLHRNVTGDDVHTTVWRHYANTAARTGDTTLTSADVGKVARQDDAGTYWILVDVVPTWALISGGTGIPVQSTRQVIAGAGLAGGGDLSADRTFAVGAGDSSITVNADDIVVAALGITAAKIATDAVTTAKVLDANITDAKLANMGARTLKGRSLNSNGVPADIAGAGAGTYASDDGTSVGFRAVTDIIQNLNVSGDISPTQLTANQNDYSPPSLSTSTVLRLTSDATRDITGIAGGTDGRVLTLINVDSNPIRLIDASTSSSAANRFDFGFSVALLPRRAAVLWYDSTSSRWRRFNTDLEQVVEAMTDGATVTPNLDNGRKKQLTPAGNRAMAAPTGAKVDGMFLEIAIFQDGTGSRTITWTTGAGGFRFTTDVVSPTLSTGAGKVDYVLFRYNATDDRWDAMAFNKAA